jgi:hypothetical protein
VDAALAACSSFQNSSAKAEATLILQRASSKKWMLL